MITHLATLVLSFRNPLFHYPPWTLAFPCRRIFLVHYSLWPHLKWALMPIAGTAFLNLVIAGLCYLWGHRSPQRLWFICFPWFQQSQITSGHNSWEASWNSRLGVSWESSAINLFFAAELASPVWHLTRGSWKRDWMTILSPAAWPSEAFGFSNSGPTSPKFQSI